METFTIILVIAQFVFTILAGLYFYDHLKGQSVVKTSLRQDSGKEMERLEKMRAVKLTEPLGEKSRPSDLKEVIGQEDGIKALRAALCGPNPQHVLIYGPPGVGKTAAARLILEEAKKITESPFMQTAKFVEIDATTLRFDERNIADPLMGSVHDPIYQGAGSFGAAGIPQPKEGAVTKAHGGILFIDEIGEMHAVQMNKLLKVLEDRRVYFSSSYYSEDNHSIPRYIHEIFKNGMPADFRLIGATTRNPEDIPPALRSRCTEIFFNDLKVSHMKEIAKNAVDKIGSRCEEGVIEDISRYAANGRDVVNMVQTAASVAFMEKRMQIVHKDIDWVIEQGRYAPRFCKTVPEEQAIGVVNGLAVYGGGKGALLEIEAYAQKAEVSGKGKMKLTGIAEEEELKSQSGCLRRKSNIRSSFENAVTALEQREKISIKDYDIHVNFPGGTAVDGPSAGIAIYCALYSAIFNQKVLPKTAMTGEISIYGKVLPVGGVTSKIHGAMEAGAKTVIIPWDNWQSFYSDFPIHIVRASHISQVMALLFDSVSLEKEEKAGTTESINILTAEGMEA